MHRTVQAVSEFLLSRVQEVHLEESSAADLPPLGVTVSSMQTIAKTCDIAIVIGGDGTFLGAARSLMGSGIPLLGINMGRLGFLTDVVPGDATEALAQVMDGKFEEEHRFLLNTQVMRDKQCLVDVCALNDVVAHKWRIARLLTFETYIDSVLVNSQRSDGLIVTTPTGSTAYALSSGGPILHPSLDAIALVPICPHTLSTRPIVVQGSSEIEIVLSSGDQPEAQLTCDGQTAMELSPGDRIHISKHPQPLRLIHPLGHDYYATLRAKLHWGREF